MTVYYLDSSAWVKRYAFEIGSSFVSELFSKNESLARSTLGRVEVVASLARKRKAGALQEEELNLLMQRLQEGWLGFYQIPLGGNVIDSALELARSDGLRGADALHLASAALLRRFLDEQRNELVFVGSDQDLNRAAKRIGIAALDPHDKVERGI